MMKDLKWILGILLVVLVLLYIFIPRILIGTRGDPLPASVRTYFNKVEYTGFNIRALVERAKAIKSESSLTDIRTEYESLSANYNRLIEKAIEGLNLNTVDTPFLRVELEQLDRRANALHAKLQSKFITRVSADSSVDDWLAKFWEFVSRANQAWAQLWSKDEDLKKRVIL